MHRTFFVLHSGAFEAEIQRHTYKYHECYKHHHCKIAAGYLKQIAADKLSDNGADKGIAVHNGVIGGKVFKTTEGAGKVCNGGGEAAKTETEYTHADEKQQVVFKFDCRQQEYHAYDHQHGNDAHFPATALGIEDLSGNNTAKTGAHGNKAYSEG